MNDEPRVLIIEDNDALRAMLFAVLRHQPLAVDTAASANDAISRVLTCDYALILLDMHLPERNSEIFLQQFRAQRPEATSFVVAVRDPNQDIYIDPEMVVAVLNKPLELDLLGEVVRECAFLVPPPAEPLPCEASESEIMGRMSRAWSLAH